MVPRLTDEKLSKIAVWNLILYLYSIFTLRVYFYNPIENIFETYNFWLNPS